MSYLFFLLLGCGLVGCQVDTPMADDGPFDASGGSDPHFDAFQPAFDAQTFDAETWDAGHPDSMAADAARINAPDAGQGTPCAPGPSARHEGDAVTLYEYDEAERLVVETHSSRTSGDVHWRITHQYSPGEVIIETDFADREGIEIREVQQLDADGHPVTAQNYRYREQTDGTWHRQRTEDGQLIETVEWVAASDGQPTMCLAWTFDRVGRLTLRTWRPYCDETTRSEHMAYSGDGSSAHLTVFDQGELEATFDLDLNRCGQPERQQTAAGLTQVTWQY